jgi:outer membrane protein insertion porin family
MPYILILLFILISQLIFAQDPEEQDTTGRNLYELQNINFNGNVRISSSELSDIIYSRETPWWFWKFLNSFTPLGSPPVYFDSSDIKQDLTALSDYYRTNGFFQAKLSYNYTIDSSAREVSLNYLINEGDPSHFGKIKILGADSVNPGIMEDVYSDMTLDSASVFNQDEVQQNTANSIQILKNSGYPFAVFDSTLVFIDTTENRSDLDIYITTGNYFLIDTIIVRKRGEGAGEVSDNTLRRITGLVKDEYYSEEEVKRGESRLFRTSIFSSVTLEPADSNNSSGRLPIRLNGIVGRMNELSPEIIMNNQQNALNVGTAFNYIRKNFLGAARKMTASFSVGLQDIFNIDYGNLINRFSFRDTTLLGYIDARVTIEQPYMFNEPISGILENYFTIEKQNDFNVTRYGAKLTFDFELPHYTFINFFNAYYNIEQRNEVFRLRSDSLSAKFLSLIGFTAGRNTSDNLLFPTKGYNISLTAEEANSLPYLFDKIFDVSYKGALFYRLILNASHYQAWNKKRNFVFASKFRTGYLHPFIGDYGGLPINETFYAGGSNSVRGWRSNKLIPQGTPVISGFEGENRKGGTFLLEGSFETRYKFMENVGAALFFDYGNVWLDYNYLKPNSIALAAGIGFRYYSQVAPFRIDFGFKLYDPESKTFLWKSPTRGIFRNMEFHFGIGEAF